MVCPALSTGTLSSQKIPVCGELLSAVMPVSPADLAAARMQMALSLGEHIVVACLGVGCRTPRR